MNDERTENSPSDSSGKSKLEKVIDIIVEEGDFNNISERQKVIFQLEIQNALSHFVDYKSEKNAHSDMQKAIDGIRQAENAFERLQDSVFYELAAASRVPLNWPSSDDPEQSTPADQEKRFLISSLEQLRKELEAQKQRWSRRRQRIGGAVEAPTADGRGRRRLMRSYAVAYAIAHIFYELSGRETVPGFGDGDANEPRNPFTRAVRRSFNELGIKVKFREPAEEAVTRLKEKIASERSG